MAWRFPTSHYIAQILAYEDDVPRLLQDVQLHVAAGGATCAAVMLCRFSVRDIATEEEASHAESERRPTFGLDVGGGELAAYNDATSTIHQRRTDSRSKLTLTLLHLDTTWRFDHYESRLASPKLSWPAILRFFKPGTSVGLDLILTERFLHSEAPRTLC